MREPLEFQYDRKKTDLSDNVELLKKVIEAQDETAYYKRLALVYQLDSDAARLVIAGLVDEILEVLQPLTWRERYRLYGEHCNEENALNPIGTQKHHMKPKRDGGKEGKNIAKCSDFQHGVLHYLLYRLEGNAKDLEIIQKTGRPGKK